MLSPFEELEYLADMLPDEGETVVITRKAGELQCRPQSSNDLRDGIDDAELYGILVQANEQLIRCGSGPLWIASIAVFWEAILLHGVLGISLVHWYLVPSLAFLSLYAAIYCARVNQHRHFRTELLPVITREMSRRRIRSYALMAGMRQHEELRTLLNEFTLWTPDRHLPMT